jgi:hypothetical protein
MSAAAGTLDLTTLGAPASAAPVRPKCATLIWFATVASVLLILALAAAGKGEPLRVAIPATATLVGLALYLRRPIGYLHFTLWTWFVTPLIRRLVDWRFGFEDQNMVLLAPFLVTAISGITLLREHRNTKGLNLAPYLLCVAGIIYGFLVGVIRWELHASEASSLGAVVYGLFMWLAPLLFGLHLYLRWRSYEQHKEAVEKSFLWAVLLLGLYGIYQYIFAPPWDCAWLEGLPMGYENSSFGRPFPYEIRVWSTSNSPGTFAAIMFPGLIFLTGISSRNKHFASAIGFAALLLSLVRTAWIAWLLAMILLIVRYKGPALRRSILGLLLLPVCLLPIAFDPQIEQAIVDRVGTTRDLEKDGSYEDRTKMYQIVTGELLDAPSGLGLLNITTVGVDGFALDSGFLQTLLMLGFVGCALFVAGIAASVVTIMRGGRARSREAIGNDSVFRAVFLVSLAELVGTNVFINLSGVVLWICFSLWISVDARIRIADGVACAESSRNALPRHPRSSIGERAGVQPV